MNIITRLSEDRDMQKLVELDNSTWNENNAPVEIHWENTTEYVKYNPAGSQIIAECGNEICGYISLKNPTKLSSNSHVVEIVIAVDSKYRNSGIGRMLLNEVYDWGMKSGKNKISLRVLSSNESALNFYLKCGFVIQGRLLKEFVINNKYIDDILLYKFIER